MKGNTVVASTVLIGFCGCALAQSNLAFASEFWADKRGGGAEDVLLQGLLPQQYKGSFRQDIVLPNSNGSYVISTSEAAKVLLPYERVSLREEGSKGKASTASRSRQVSAIDGVLDVSAGSWIITPDLSSRKGGSAAALAADTADSLNEAYVEFDKGAPALAVTKKDSATERGSLVTVTASNRASGSKTSLKKADVVATVYLQGRALRTVKMTDDGLESNGDAVRGDGVFSAAISLVQPGDYSILIDSTASDGAQRVDRATVVRSSVSGARLVVGNPVVAVTQGHVGETTLEDQRYGIELDVTLKKGTMPDIVDTYAEVWARDMQGSDVVVGWTGGLVAPYRSPAGRWIMPFTFHSGWLALDQFQGPMSLRALSVRDIDTNDDILVIGAKAARIDLPIDPVSAMSQTKSGATSTREAREPTTAMETGVHPSLLPGATTDAFAQARVGTRSGSDRIVLSLHGFCDGGKSLAGFSSTVRDKGYVYTESRTGQSADRYAVEVMQHFGYRAGKVRGIVAHSHGGMAAASLLDNFSYFFADNLKSKPVNVVSMGTPYHGTSLLEGRLPGWVESALIGLFQYATGCTIPRELYPSSNASWNNSIAWRARFQISSWYTTHTKPTTFENRDCRDTLSAQIPGSDDGVLAPRNGLGFADGGNYDLHYSGHCHTPGMGQGDQWRNPRFVTFVNDIFHAPVESWQPF